MNKKLKILILPHYVDQSIPMRTQAAEIFGNYFSKKHKCISIIKKKSDKTHFYWNNIEFWSLSFLKFIRKIFQLAKSEKFDLVFIRDDLLLLIIGLILKLRYNIPILIHYTIPIKFITDFDFKWYHPKSIGGTIKHILTLKLMKKVDLVLPTSEWMGKYLFSNGIDLKKIHNYPNGANLNLFKITEYPISIKDPIFIYIGAISKIRSIDILIHSMRIVKEKYENAHLYMLGTGDNDSNLKNLAIKLGLEKNITFTGQIPYEKVPEYIEKSHITLCTIAPLYHYKLASPLKLFEYMSCSRPVIANREIPAHIKPITEGKCGILVDFTPESIAAAMIKLFEQPEKSREMGINGRKWLEENRSYERISRELETRIFTDFFS